MMHFQDVLNNFITMDKNIIKGLMYRAEQKYGPHTGGKVKNSTSDENFLNG